jgi:hypothetical protein
MELPVIPWYKAIFIRRSRRSLLAVPPPQAKLDMLRRTCSEFRPFPGARAELILKSGTDVFKGVVGAYGKIRNITGYVAFIGDMQNPHVQEAVGYTGEGIILQATVLNLATCWVGGFFHPEMVRKHIALKGQEKVLAVSPIGMAPESISFQEKLMSGFGYMHRRKSLQNMISGNLEVAWMRTALQAARLAPSAVNRQPWRFLLGEQSITVTVAKGPDSYNIARRLDCGIAMLHLELGARYAGVSGSWTFPPEHAGVFTAGSIDLQP